ncbi:DUF1566 domain-containing protein [Dyella caseinilytica]|uniref:DUF1566 domain-containing protein n=1 Tax=Dyella caseinilytica TaxID=1849581 RepID=A0ABX7GXK2_9GAMM|nr:DUF1566 domain-containing protein [Dyella caseinilytica]QRN55225.1 DUF1566 domain-containing protein [Dyella caseinilytica]GGA00222.1 hypothetical protein GCM10011408_21390 [Dyella caseinilytica]
MNAQPEHAVSRFIKLAADGSHLAPDANDYTGILNIRDGIVTVYASDRYLTQSDAEKACAKLAQLPGHTPWQLISDKDGELIIDRRFYNPAVDPEEYPHIMPEPHWTRTDYKSSSDVAWGVNFYGGSVGCNSRSGRARALAVCRPVPASQ